MLDKETERKILDFVHQQPRSVQEIAQFIDSNWRTADAYIEKIAAETGQIGTRIFRGGTRGALKIVFWANIARLSSNEFQERMYRKIEIGRRKEDFSPLELYAYIPEDKRKAWKARSDKDNPGQHKNLTELLAQAREQVLIFTGNCSFINLVQNDKPMLELVKELVQRGVTIKVLSRVDMASIKNLQKMLEVNYALGEDAIEIRHAEQPLRGFVVDDKIVRLKEELDPSRYRAGELDGDAVLLYEFYDAAWVKWVQNVFWALYRTALSGQKRLEDLGSIQKL